LKLEVTRKLRDIDEADLRDQFAMAALTGYISADTEYQCPATHLAEWSYDVADAMLEARKVEDDRPD
jgi:hypothetical protein